MTAPLTKSELTTYKENNPIIYSSLASTPFIGSLKSLVPGFISYDGKYQIWGDELFKNKPIGTYVCMQSTCNSYNPALVVKIEEDKYVYVHRVNLSKFQNDVEKSSQLPAELVPQLTPMADILCLDMIEEKVNILELLEKYPNVTTLFFINPNRFDQLIDYIQQTKTLPHIRFFAPVSFGPANSQKYIALLRHNTDHPSFPLLLKLLLRNVKSKVTHHMSFFGPNPTNPHSILFNNRKLSDCEIRVGEKSIIAHKIFLLGFSEFFERKFIGTNKVTPNICDLSEWSYEVVYETLKHFYTGDADFSRCNDIELLMFTNFLSVRSKVFLLFVKQPFLKEKSNPATLVDLVETQTLDMFTEEEKFELFSLYLYYNFDRHLSETEDKKTFYSIYLQEIEKII